MVNVKQFKHTLIDNISSITLQLTHEPAGWENLNQRHYRHKDYHTILFEDGTSIRFVKEGKEFIENAERISGTKADVTYIRDELNRFTNQYETDYEGKLDFNPDSGWKNEDEFFEIKTIVSSKLNRFLIRDEIDYNLFSLKSSDGITIPDFATAPYKEASYKPIDLFLNVQTSGSFDLSPRSSFFNDPAIIPYQFEATTNNIDSRLNNNDESVLLFYENKTNQEVILQDIFLDLNYDCYFTVDKDSATSITYAIYISFNVYNADGVLIYHGNIPTDGSNTTSNVIREIFNATRTHSDITIPINCTLELAFNVEINTGTYPINFNTGAFATVNEFSFTEFTAGYEQNNIKGLMLNEALGRHIQLMTSETDKSKILYAPPIGKTDSDFYSYLTAGDYAYEHITNGRQLRQFTESSINCSFKDTFKTLDSIRPVGLWFDKTNNYFVLDYLENFYKIELSPIHLGKVKDLVRSPSNDYYFNKILSGYPNIDFETFQGANEFNTALEHDTFIETKDTFDLRSRYNASSVAIEESRRKNKKLSTNEDTKYDNLIFITKLDSSYETLQGNLNGAAGFDGIEQYYNLEKTPRQNLVRQLKIWQALLYKQNKEYFRFIKSDKPTNISYTFNGITINEYDDIDKNSSELTPAWPPVFESLVQNSNKRTFPFYPEFYEFEAPYTREIRQQIKIDPHVVWPFTDKNGNEKYGYIEEVKGNPYTRIGSYKLIAANLDRINSII